MPKCYLIVGPPAAGKSTLAKEFIDQGFYHLERDVIRREVFGFTDWESWDWRKEKWVTGEWEARLSNLVFNHKNIVISDTLCKQKDRDRIVSRMKTYGYEVDVIILNPPLNVLLERDKQRGAFSVGEDVIKMMYINLNGES